MPVTRRARRADVASWSQKTYVMISSEIKRLVDELRPGDMPEMECLKDLALNLKARFASDNPEFNPDRFMKACGF